MHIFVLSAVFLRSPWLFVLVSASHSNYIVITQSLLSSSCLEDTVIQGKCIKTVELHPKVSKVRDFDCTNYNMSPCMGKQALGTACQFEGQSHLVSVNHPFKWNKY